MVASQALAVVIQCELDVRASKRCLHCRAMLHEDDRVDIGVSVMGIPFRTAGSRHYWSECGHCAHKLGTGPASIARRDIPAWVRR